MDSLQGFENKYKIGYSLGVFGGMGNSVSVFGERIDWVKGGVVVARGQKNERLECGSIHRAPRGILSTTIFRSILPYLWLINFQQSILLFS